MASRTLGGAGVGNESSGDRMAEARGGRAGWAEPGIGGCAGFSEPPLGGRAGGPGPSMDAGVD
jgi:hypothetical protein